ncbi:atypical membrane-integrating protein (Mistic protein) [Lentibacillus amyloliquefaciens]|nr:atypical membrane-integrating protein (Mistic protein) [Lentibacillus amyloliquefaciens]
MMMKANDTETKRFDKALDEILDLFNNLEDDKPVINYSMEVLQNIERAKLKYGSDMVDKKINTVVYEMLSWLDLNDVKTEDEG